MKITRGWLIRVTGSALILGLTLWILPTDAVLDGFRALDPLVFAAVLGLFLLGHMLAAGKWWALCDRTMPLPTALRAHFAGLAANLCLPGVAGGDAVRGTLAVTGGGDTAKVVAGAVGDRLIDMMALGLLSATGLLFMADLGGSAAVVLQVLALLALLLVGAFGGVPWAAPKLVAALPKLPAKALILKMSSALADLARRPGRMTVALLLSFCIQGQFVLLTVWLAVSIGAEPMVAAWVFAWPLAKILAVLPISLAGIGVREATLAALLTPLGAVAATVVAASLIWQAVLFAAGILGAIAWALTSSPQPQQTSPAE